MVFKTLEEVLIQMRRVNASPNQWNKIGNRATLDLEESVETNDDIAMRKKAR